MPRRSLGSVIHANAVSSSRGSSRSATPTGPARSSSWTAAHSVSDSMHQHDGPVAFAARHQLMTKANVGECDLMPDLDVELTPIEPLQQAPDGGPGGVCIAQQRVQMKPEDALRP